MKNPDKLDKSKRGARYAKKNIGLILPGYFPIKVSIDELLKDWKRSKAFIKEMHISDEETEQEIQFPRLETKQKHSLQKRLIRFFYVYAVLMLLTPLAVSQSLSNGLYSPLLIALGFLLVALAKIAECSFYSYQIRINRFAKPKEWISDSQNWRPRH